MLQSDGAPLGTGDASGSGEITTPRTIEIAIFSNPSQVWIHCCWPREGRKPRCGAQVGRAGAGTLAAVEGPWTAKSRSDNAEIFRHMFRELHTEADKLAGQETDDHFVAKYRCPMPYVRWELYLQGLRMWLDTQRRCEFGSVVHIAGEGVMHSGRV